MTILRIYDIRKAQWPKKEGTNFRLQLLNHRARPEAVYNVGVDPAAFKTVRCKA